MKHQHTLDNWSNDGKVWLWYLGTYKELEELSDGARQTYGSRVEVGPPCYAEEKATHYCVFVFERKDDAMMFKLGAI